MNSFKNIPVYILITLMMAAWVQPEIQQDPLTESQTKGKSIYTSGKSGSNIPVTAMMSGVEVPGTVMPCVNCHGKNGEGKAQGDIIPPDISWQSLSRPVKGKKPKNGRPAYDEKQLKKAITMGLKSSGTPLHKLMPKYNMGIEDIENLIDYLKVLGKE